MPPKKKATDAQVVDEKRQQLDCLRRQCQAVEQLIMLSNEEKRHLEHEKTVLKKKLAELQEQCETTEKRMEDQLRTMQHLTVTCDEQLWHRLKSLESKVADAEEGNAALHLKIEETTRKRLEELQRLKDGVAELRQQLESKALACGVQLRDFLLTHS
ncbi:hypothetical protein C3747_103g94 [Trypanosoma cruzi]|uniref:Uncharacterized protein n=1 Tax=Trypanosoma cruzi TaxID=5693 RepID=A0A2V2WFG0_TRYCR|nr:hypothetical protein C3747_103g94 [Trypanosoma cruzi]